MAVTCVFSSALTVEVPATPPNYSVNSPVRVVTGPACARPRPPGQRVIAGVRLRRATMHGRPWRGASDGGGWVGGVVGFVVITWVVFGGIGGCEGSSRGRDSRGGEMVLRVSPDTIRIRAGDIMHGVIPPSALKATLENTGPGAGWVVQAGDGSDYGWRFPVTGWSVVPDSAEIVHPSSWPGPPQGSARCGNMAGYQEDDFVLLKGGVHLKLEGWIVLPKVPGSGRYRALMYYEIDPNKGPRFDRLTGHYGETISKKIRSLEMLALRSNEVVLVVEP